MGEVVRAELHRGHGGFDAGVGGQEDHQDVLVELLHLLQNADAVRVRQPVVEQHQVDAFRQLLQGSRPGVGFDDLVALGRQPLPE